MRTNGYIHDAQTMCDHIHEAIQKRAGTCGRQVVSDLLDVEGRVVVEEAMNLGEDVPAELAQPNLATLGGFCFKVTSLCVR